MFGIHHNFLDAGGGGVTLPDDFLLFHQFDGTNGASVDGVNPDLCYDATTTFAVTGSPVLNGSGYLVAAANNNLVTVDPDTRWPSRSGKTRIYEFWGRYAAAPSSTSDYMPQVRINYVDSSNFWAARLGHGTNAVYNDQYEWISGGVGELNSSSTATMAGAFRWCLRIEDQEDQVLSSCIIQRESTEASDLDISQSPAVQLYKSSRPNQSEAQFQFRWESPSNYANCQLRGMMVYDR